MVCVLNLSDAKRWDYGVWVPGAKRTMPLIDTDWQRFSGSDPNQAQEWHEVYDETLRVTLAPFSGQLLLIE